MARAVVPAIIPGVSAQTMAIACREISALLKAGIALDQALDSASHVKPSYFGVTLANLGAAVANGNPLSNEMRSYRALFHPIMPAIVAAGELSGSLDASFDLLAEFYEAEAQLKRTVQSALIYPGIVVIVAILAVALLAYIGFMPATWAVALTWGVVVVVLLWLLMRLRLVQMGARYLASWLPFFGKLMQELAVARFCYTFGLLIRAGVPYLEGLEATRPVAQHPAVDQAIAFVYASVRNGNTVEDSIRSQPVFPPVVHNLVGSGEMAGSLDSALLKAAEYLRADAEFKIRNTSKFVGPVAIIVLGIIVALILVSFWTSYFNTIFSVLE